MPKKEEVQWEPDKSKPKKEETTLEVKRARKIKMPDNRPVVNQDVDTYTNLLEQQERRMRAPADGL